MVFELRHAGEGGKKKKKKKKKTHIHARARFLPPNMPVYPCLLLPHRPVVTVIGAAKGGPPPEKNIKISNINAPQLGWKNRPDQPFAWAAREALRSRLIGQVGWLVDWSWRCKFFFLLAAG